MQLTKSLTALTATLVVAGAAPVNGTDSNVLDKRQSFDGIATVYYQGGAAGSCGQVNSDGAMVGSVSYSFANSLCGRRVRVTNTHTTTDMSIGGQGNVIEVVIADTCAGCDAGHIDLSVAGWNALTNTAYPSQVGVTWARI